MPEVVTATNNRPRQDVLGVGLGGEVVIAALGRHKVAAGELRVPGISRITRSNLGRVGCPHGHRQNANGQGLARPPKLIRLKRFMLKP